LPIRVLVFARVMLRPAADDDVDGALESSLSEKRGQSQREEDRAELATHHGVQKQFNCDGGG